MEPPNGGSKSQALNHAFPQSTICSPCTSRRCPKKIIFRQADFHPLHTKWTLLSPFPLPPPHQLSQFGSQLSLLLSALSFTQAQDEESAKCKTLPNRTILLVSLSPHSPNMDFELYCNSTTVTIALAMFK